MSKNTLIAVVVTALVVAAGFVFNPSPERHREEIQRAIGERSPLAKVLGIGAVTAFVSTYHPLGVASYTTVNGRTVSIGAFGMVYVRQPDQP